MSPFHPPAAAKAAAGDRPGEVRIRCRMRRGVFDAGNALERRADLHVDLRHRYRRGTSPAVSQFCSMWQPWRRSAEHFDEGIVPGPGGILHIAEISRLMSGAESALDDDAVGKPGAGSKVEPEPVVVHALLPGNIVLDRPCRLLTGTQD